jgi:hypothetical protein
MNVGLTVVEFVKDAELVAGLEVIVQAYVRESLFASLLRAPVNATVELVVTFWFVPEFATGATFALADVIVTVEVVLFNFPSLTTKLTT